VFRKSPDRLAKGMGAAGWTVSIIAIVIVLMIAIRELGWRR